MRLGQLSRKLGLTPSDILDFLREKDPGFESGPNTRLTDEQVLSAIRRFDPAHEADILKEDAAAPELAEAPSEAQVSEPALPLEADALNSAEQSTDASLEPTPEVIRAPKQELPGLRVVGKIQLKDAKKKEAEPPAGQEGQDPGSEESNPRPSQPRTERPSRPVRRDAPPRTWKNPLEVQRQREAEERKQKRQQEIQREKERRTQKYLSKVKSAPTKPVRKQEETVIEPQAETRPAPKTWLGKIARWLTT